ncbi:MAG: hypothetical protein RL571_1677 [Pseudomonadota bacterium]|jgi:hypothetical protein
MSYQLQNFIARLAVDPFFYNSYKSERESTCREMGLSVDEINSAMNLDLDSFEVFKKVIQGSRGRQFELYLPQTRALVTDKNWGELLQRFHNETLIATSKNLADLYAFCLWLAEEFPNSQLSDLALYEYSLCSLTMPNMLQYRKTYPFTQVDQYALKERHCLLMTTHHINDLTSTHYHTVLMSSINITPCFFILRENEIEKNIDIIELDRTTYLILHYLIKPRTRQQLMSVFDWDCDKTQEAILELLDAGLLTQINEPVLCL